MTSCHFNCAGWTSKVLNRRILHVATKTITNCWWTKNRFCMKSKRQKNAINLLEHFSFTNFDPKLRAKTDIDRKLIKLLNDFCYKKICIFMCEQDLRELGDYKIFIFLQMLNFRALTKHWTPTEPLTDALKNHREKNTKRCANQVHKCNVTDVPEVPRMAGECRNGLTPIFFCYKYKFRSQINEHK